MQKTWTGIFDLKRIIKATAYSLSGLQAAFINEPAFRQEVVAFIVLAPTGYFLASTAIERVLLVGSLLLVLIVELLNSALEAVVDRVGTEHHELSGRAKDLGSAAVLMSIVLVVLVWLFVLVL